MYFAGTKLIDLRTGNTAPWPKVILSTTNLIELIVSAIFIRALIPEESFTTTVFASTFVLMVILNWLPCVSDRDSRTAVERALGVAVVYIDEDASCSFNEGII